MIDFAISTKNKHNSDVNIPNSKITLKNESDFTISQQKNINLM